MPLQCLHKMLKKNCSVCYLWPLSIIGLNRRSGLGCLWQVNNSCSCGGCRVMGVVFIVEVRLQCCCGTIGEHSACLSCCILGCWGCVSCYRHLCRCGPGRADGRHAVQWLYVGVIHNNTCCSAFITVRYLMTMPIQGLHDLPYKLG
jgi:hypothetical protein